MGKSGNPAKRAQKGPQRRTRRDLIDVSTDEVRGLVILDVGGQKTGMTAETCKALENSLATARAVVEGPTTDDRPHSRACGMSCRGHGTDCAKDCPTCGGEGDRA